MSKTIKDLSILILINFLITFLIWLPHILQISNFYNLNFSGGFANIYRNFDGLDYIVIAKTFYNPALIAKIPQTLSASYYAAHFPLYSLFILLTASFLGMLKSMLFISVSFTIASSITFYLLIKDFNLTKQPLWLSVVFLVLPARWLIVHSTGSSEPMFIFFVISSIYFFLKFENFKKIQYIFLSAILGLGAQLTRPPGILLFLAFILYLGWKYLIPNKNVILARFDESARRANTVRPESFRKIVEYYPLILIPLGLLGVFYLFGLTYNDFWAYFHSGDNIHLTFPPFQVFNKNQFWIGDIWLEDVIFTFALGLLGGLLLIKQKLYLLAFFVLTYLTATSLVVHRDISRYALPIFPFCLIAFEKMIISKEFKIVLGILLLAIYLYTQNFLINNIAPISNLAPYN